MRTSADLTRLPEDGPAIRLVSARAHAQSLSLRDKARLYLIRDASACTASIPLDSAGCYLCVSLAGELCVGTGPNSRILPSRKVHILRQPADAPHRQIDFHSAVTLAAVVFFSPQWCMACPNGSNCRVAQFLLRGPGGADRSGDQALDIDRKGLLIARALFDAHIDADADMLTIERSVLALLSWTFARGSGSPAPPIADIPLHPQVALKVRQAAEILRQRIGDPPTISQLSAFVGLNESDLKRCFKCLYGKGVAGYSRERRLETARDLLTHSPLGVADVALEVGFSNPSQFARAFRRQFGRNPSEFRRSPH